MRTILHVLTRPDDPLALKVIEGQRKLPDTDVQVVELSAAHSEYSAVVARIFEADSVEVW